MKKTTIISTPSVPPVRKRTPPGHFLRKAHWREVPFSRGDPEGYETMVSSHLVRRRRKNKKPAPPTLSTRKFFIKQEVSEHSFYIERMGSAAKWHVIQGFRERSPLPWSIGYDTPIAALMAWTNRYMPAV